MTSTRIDPFNEPRALIELVNVSKTYAGTGEAAVHDLSLAVREGEILVLVGPSGCGKSTTLRLINRMIEPTSGSIIFEGANVTRSDPNDLRRRIGYVIQQIGLFPHRTIAENIGTVPRLLQWDKKRIAARVEEMLELVGMDPKVYAARYPRELSGGQAQRVGVARALAADPDVLLMDEPFGAIDPITRDRLQNEFLRLQAELKKTIVFVTHDIDEAVKMGDRIAILREQSIIAQLDRPEMILTDPADDFVENFLGSGAILKTLTLSRVRDLELSQIPTVRLGASRSIALATVEGSATGFAVLLDAREHPIRWVDARSLDNASKPIEQSGRGITVMHQPEDTLQDALSSMLQTSTGMSVIVDGRGRYLGCVTIEALAQLLVQTQSGAA